MTTKIAFIVPGAPVGKGRPRATTINGMARLYTPKKTANYEGLIALAAQTALAGRPMLDGPVALRLVLHCQVPASWSGKKQRQALAGEHMPTTKPDVDNVLKAVCDGCNGVLWRDDVQVVELTLSKRYAATPCVRVEAWPLGVAVEQAPLLALEPA